MVIALGVLVVWAYNSGQNPAFVGHTAEELDLSGGVNGNAVFNGNVGIGTTNPQYKLDVNGNIHALGDISGSKLCIGTDCINTWPGAISHLTKVEKTGCWRGGTHTLQSICPNGYKLLSCAGGPGDLMEDYEGWYITPDFSKNSCFLYIKEPACTDTYDLTYQRVIAICYI